MSANATTEPDTTTVDTAGLDRRVIGRTTRTSKIHTAAQWGGIYRIICRSKGKHLTITQLITTSPTDHVNDLRAALAPFEITHDELCAHCFRDVYGPITIRLTHAAREALSYRFSRNRFTEHTLPYKPIDPGPDGYHHIPLTYHARATIAGCIAPDGDEPGHVWHDGIFTTAWDEIAEAFPRSMAHAGTDTAAELAGAFPLDWFTAWAALHPRNPEEEDCANCYNPEFGL